MATKNVKLNDTDYNGVDKVKLPLSADTSSYAEFVETSDANAVASDISQGKTAYVNGTKITGTNSGGGGEAVLIEKTITENGTYNAVDDSADGYSQVTVNVPTGGGKTGLVIESYDATSKILKCKEYGETAQPISIQANGITVKNIEIEYDESTKTIPITCYRNSPGVIFKQTDGKVIFPGVTVLNQQCLDNCGLTGEVEFPELTTAGLTPLSKISITKLKCPKLVNIGPYRITNTITTLTETEFGSDDYTVATIEGHPCDVTGTCIVHTTGDKVDAFVTKIKGDNPNATVVMIASVDTTYGGQFIDNTKIGINHLNESQYFYEGDFVHLMDNGRQLVAQNIANHLY